MLLGAAYIRLARGVEMIGTLLTQRVPLAASIVALECPAMLDFQELRELGMGRAEAKPIKYLSSIGFARKLNPSYELLVYCASSEEGREIEQSSGKISCENEKAFLSSGPCARDPECVAAPDIPFAWCYGSGSRSCPAGQGNDGSGCTAVYRLSADLTAGRASSRRLRRNWLPMNGWMSRRRRPGWQATTIYGSS